MKQCREVSFSAKYSPRQKMYYSLAEKIKPGNKRDTTLNDRSFKRVREQGALIWIAKLRSH